MVADTGQFSQRANLGLEKQGGRSGEAVLRGGGSEGNVNLVFSIVRSWPAALIASLSALACPLAASAQAQYQFVDLAPNNTPAAAYGALVTPDGNQQDGAYSPTPATSGQPTEAAIFNGSGGPIVDLGPGLVAGGYIDPGGVHQVGAQQASSSGPQTATIWSGSASSAISLQPPGWYSAGAGSGYYSAATGAQQLGNGTQTKGGINQALLWSGTAASFVDLTPAGWTGSGGYASFATTTGGEQVGTVTNAQNQTYAAVWSGNASSFINLNPSGSTLSYALGAAATPSGGRLIVGTADFGTLHPIVWLSSDPENFVDLDSLVGDGELVATNGRLVLGYASRPFVWDSQTGSVTYLSSYTPSTDYFPDGTAIDADGDVVGSVATIPPGETEPVENHAVEWVAIPEPTTVAWLGMVAAVLTSRMKRRRTGHE
jgi:hypothetical protein